LVMLATSAALKGTAFATFLRFDAIGLPQWVVELLRILDGERPPWSFSAR